MITVVRRVYPDTRKHRNLFEDRSANMLKICLMFGSDGALPPKAGGDEEVGPNLNDPEFDRTAIRSRDPTFDS